MPFLPCPSPLSFLRSARKRGTKGCNAALALHYFNLAAFFFSPLVSPQDVSSKEQVALLSGGPLLGKACTVVSPFPLSFGWAFHGKKFPYV